MARSTLAELSERLGLSKPTISRALNDYPDIADKTKARVREAAIKMGYTASTAARRLQRGKSDTIGLVLEPGIVGLQSTYQSEFTAALAASLSERDLDLIVHYVPQAEDEVPAYLRLARSGKVDGFVLLRTRRDDQRVEALLKENIPFVTQGRTQHSNRHAWYDIDLTTAFRDATQHLAELGHKDIAFVTGNRSAYSSELRFEGYRAGLEAASIDFDPSRVYDGDFSAESGRRAFNYFFSRANKPSAVVCANDATAMGMLAEANDAGFEVPKQLSVIGYDGVRMGELSSPPLTTMRHSAAEVGQKIAGMLIKLIESGNAAHCIADNQILAPAELALRGSTSKAPE